MSFTNKKPEKVSKTHKNVLCTYLGLHFVVLCFEKYFFSPSVGIMRGCVVEESKLIT